MMMTPDIKHRYVDYMYWKSTVYCFIPSGSIPLVREWLNQITKSTLKGNFTVVQSHQNITRPGTSDSGKASIKHLLAIPFQFIFSYLPCKEWGRILIKKKMYWSKNLTMSQCQFIPGLFTISKDTYIQRTICPQINKEIKGGLRYPPA